MFPHQTPRCMLLDELNHHQIHVFIWVRTRADRCLAVIAVGGALRASRWAERATVQRPSYPRSSRKLFAKFPTCEVRAHLARPELRTIPKRVLPGVGGPVPKEALRCCSHGAGAICEGHWERLGSVGEADGWLAKRSLCTMCMHDSWLFDAAAIMSVAIALRG